MESEFEIGDSVYHLSLKRGFIIKTVKGEYAFTGGSFNEYLGLSSYGELAFKQSRNIIIEKTHKYFKHLNEI